jgi:HNH endonuclease
MSGSNDVTTGINRALFSEPNEAASKRPTAKWLEGSKRGAETISERASKYIDPGCTIRLLISHNPKRGEPRIAFAKYREGQTVREFCDAVGDDAEAKAHVAWDFNHKFIEILPSGSGPYADDVDLLPDLAAVERDDRLSLTEREALVQARVGQGEFRAAVIKLWGLGEVCALSGCKLRPTLIASHVRAWRDCTISPERLDGANGILLCAHIDRLFDQHWLSFADDGKIVFEPTLSGNSTLLEDLKFLGVTRDSQLNLHKIDKGKLAKFIEYLREHRSRTLA